jgi:hypothetical protein
MYHHQSSFIHEINEISNVLNVANAQTLVISDELCSTTESESASRIAGAFIKSLVEKKSCFFFATHIFDVEKECRDVSDHVHICHLKVDMQGSEVVFDRSLYDGLPEEQRYGLIWAKRLVNDPTFCEFLADETLAYSHSTSRYNRHQSVIECNFCGYAPKTKRCLPLDTHHINQQCSADDNGIINDEMYVHDRFNLTTPCKACHIKIHAGKIIIQGYIDTEHGRKLDWNYAEEETSLAAETIGTRAHERKRARDVPNVESIKQYCKEHSFKSPKVILKDLRTLIDPKLTMKELASIQLE